MTSVATLTQLLNIKSTNTLYMYVHLDFKGTVQQWFIGNVGHPLPVVSNEQESTLYNIGNAGQTASMSTCMLTLFESRYTLKGRYNIGNVGKTASMSMLTLFESW